MNDVDIVGQVIGGSFGDILVREKSGRNLEIGDLLVSDENGSFLILQVFALEYGSQIQDKMQQMMSGVNLEQGGINAEFYEPEFVNYVLARIKPLARVAKSDDKVTLPKSLPMFFNKLRLVQSSDLTFLKRGGEQIYLGKIRSGSKIVDADVWLKAEDVFTHHILIPATTGRGKSNLVKTIMWHVLDSNKVGALVLDAHDEYYGRKDAGLKDHPKAKQNLVYYTPTPPPGANRLVINLESLRPEHFLGIVEFSDAQWQAIRSYNAKEREFWISRIMTEPLVSLGIGSGAETHIATLAVLKRKLRLILSLEVDEDGRIHSKNEVFDAGSKGLTTVDDIVRDIEAGKIVILDTSRLGNEAELIVGNIIASRIFERYKEHKAKGELERKPVVTVVIEEAPRVIGEDKVIPRNENIYSTIAKEGRKFKIGLTAITQLSSVIPRTILANMNTKIILGNEMVQERKAIIESASQDLSEDDRNIASLDKGEAIISSIFVPFAIPIKIPLFEDLIRQKDNSKELPKPKVY
ncbi:ATP-binding protein [Candidatus Nitrosotenuis cloacae]|uniref:ATP-binding protein n=1 Tax=Candidatus Nitrosotenuis cloacae TaxID=1603555 RepID=UPI00228143A9|nr:ATP-binding protein [Candidatus Nitrosotenuis cloacae]